MMMPFIILAWAADQWTGDDRVYTDPGMKRLWDRLMVEVSPDGAVIPYGPNAGWNSTADSRIASPSAAKLFRWNSNCLVPSFW